MKKELVPCGSSCGAFSHTFELILKTRPLDRIAEIVPRQQRAEIEDPKIKVRESRHFAMRIAFRFRKYAMRKRHRLDGRGAVNVNHRLS